MKILIGIALVLTDFIITILLLMLIWNNGLINYFDLPTLNVFGASLLYLTSKILR